jgi:uncharacterized protein YdaU (DUF1376 family)
MPIDVGKMIKKCEHLAAPEFGAYMRLIFHYWEHDGLPKDDARLKRIARLSNFQWPRMKEVLAQFFIMPEWRHPMIDEQLARARQVIDARRKAAACRWNANAPANAMLDAHANGMHHSLSLSKKGTNAGPQRPSVSTHTASDSGISTTPATRPKSPKLDAPPRKAPQSRSPAVGAAPATATPPGAIPNGEDEVKPEKQPAETKPWIPADTQILSSPLNFGQDPFAIRVCEYRDGRPVALHPVKGHLMVWYEAGSDGYERWHQAGWYCGVHRDKTGKSVWPFPYDAPPFEYTRGLPPS